MTWTPGRNRQRLALEDPYVGVPEHLRQHLWDWVLSGLRAGYTVRTARVTALAIHLRMPAEADASKQIGAFAAASNDDSTFLLDLAEAMLELFGWDDSRAKKLGDLLASVNSAYAINDNWRGLELRIVPGVKEAVQSASENAPGSAGTHLTSAWNEAYGRTPDPVKAYSEAIKAVEATLAGVVSPSNARATLGTLIRDVEAKPSKWRFVTGPIGVDTVLSMMRTLWNGQTSRHGGVTLTRDETAEEARAALHLAAALVQLGSSGAFAATP